MQQVESTAPRVGATARVVCAAVVGIVMLLVPTVGWSVNKPEAHLPVFAILGLLMFIACPLVFQLLSRPRRGFRYGAAFAIVVALVFAVFVVLGAFGGPVTLGAGFLGAMMVFVVLLIPGLLGACFATLITEKFDRHAAAKGTSRLQAWHVGVGIAAVELAATLLLPLFW